VVYNIHRVPLLLVILAPVYSKIVDQETNETIILKCSGSIRNRKPAIHAKDQQRMADNFDKEFDKALILTIIGRRIRDSFRENFMVGQL
jgi:hypothetical protein